MSVDVISVIADLVSTAVAVTALTISVILFYKSQREERTIQGKIANIESLATAESMLLSIPNALRFEGITEDDLDTLKQAGITLEEAAYLLIKFKAGARQFIISRRRDPSPYSPGDYRYITLTNPQTRVAWKVLRKALSDSVFKEKMDATVDLIEKLQGISSDKSAS
jgi:hypothetical protein